MIDKVIRFLGFGFYGLVMVLILGALVSVVVIAGLLMYTHMPTWALVTLLLTFMICGIFGSIFMKEDPDQYD